MIRPEDVHACAVCGRILSWSEEHGPDGSVRGWIHAELDDHLIVPVPVADGGIIPDLRCDFDSATEPTWAYPVTEEFTVAVINPERNQAHADVHGTPWLACGGCSGFVERGDLPGLIHRVVRALNEDLTPAETRFFREQLRLTYTEFLRVRAARQPIRSPR